MVTFLASCLGFLFNYTRLSLYRFLSTLERKTDWWLSCAFLFWGRGRGCKWKKNPLGSDANLGVRIGVEDAMSLDLLHDFSLSEQTCLSLFVFCVQADAFCTCSGKSWQREKSPQIAKLTSQSIGFFKGRINKILLIINTLYSNVSA